MSNERKEERLSRYIDLLNQADLDLDKHVLERGVERVLGSKQDKEQDKKQPNETDDDLELLELERIAASIKKVKDLAGPMPLPGKEYVEKVGKQLRQEQQSASSGKVMEGERPSAPSGKTSQSQPSGKTLQSQQRRSFKKVWPSVAVLVASLILFVLFGPWPGSQGKDIVLAMQEKVAAISHYHGILEVRGANAANENWLVHQVEIWSDGEKYALRLPDGTLTVNNGEKRWQVRPAERQVHILPLIPDPQKDRFDLREQAKRAYQYPHKAMGKERIAGREAVKIEISPPGGLPYYLWVDAETNLPLQVTTAMQNSLQTTYTFVSLETDQAISPDIFNFQPPAGFQVTEVDPGQQLNTPEEGIEFLGFVPVVPQEIPKKIFAYQNRLVLDYGNAVVTERPAPGKFEPASNASLGEAGDNPLEVLGERLRWYQKGLEIVIEGEDRVNLARQIAGEVTLPDVRTEIAGKAKVKVDVDMKVVEANQQQVDGGHSPWQLDPVQVAMQYVNTNLANLSGQVKQAVSVPYSSFVLVQNTGAEALIEVKSGPVEKVYLKRLIRQDESGIWSVVGYDPR